MRMCNEFHVVTESLNVVFLYTLDRFKIKNNKQAIVINKTHFFENGA